MQGGWVEGFSHATKDIFCVDNFSCGSTGILNPIYHLAMINIEDYDLIILDHFINDITFYSGARKRYFYLLGLLYQYLANSNAEVISLVFRRKELKNDHHEFHSEVIDFLSKLEKIRIFDAFKCLKEHHYNKDIDELYRDSAHPHPEYSYKVGEKLADSIKLDGRNTAGGKKFPFYILKDTEMCTKQRLRVIKNRLINIKCLDIIDRKDIEIPSILTGGSLIGFHFDSSNSDGFLNINKGFYKIVGNSNIGKKPVIWARPIHFEIHVRETLNLVVVKSAKEHERTDFCSIAKLQGGAKLGLVALIFLLPEFT